MYIKNRLKPKLAWPLCTKSMKTKNGTRTMTKAKNNVFIGLLLENCYLVGEMNFWWMEDKNLLTKKSNAERIFPGGRDEQILDR